MFGDEQTVKGGKEMGRMTILQVTLIGLFLTLTVVEAVLMVALYLVFKKKFYTVDQKTLETVSLWDEEGETPTKVNVSYILLLCFSMLLFIVACIVVVKMLPGGGSFYLKARILSPFVGFIVCCVKKKHRVLFYCVLCLAVFIVGIMFHFLIGFPVSPVTLEVDGMPVIVGDSTVQSLEESGFSLAIRDIEPAPYYLFDTDKIFYATLSLEDISVAELKLFRVDANVSDSIAIEFVVNEETLDLLDENGISIRIDGLSLNNFNKTDFVKQYDTKEYNTVSGTLFGDHGDENVIIKTSSSGHVFWKEYVINLCFDDTQNDSDVIDKFRLVCNYDGFSY